MQDADRASGGNKAHTSYIAYGDGDNVATKSHDQFDLNLGLVIKP